MSAAAVLTRPSDPDTDDRDLVLRVHAGDDRAFELLYQRYEPRIAAYVRGMVRDHGRAEDITQEVFIAALRRMRIDSEREIHFKPWIYEIAKNKCIDAFRRGRSTSEVSFDADDAIGAAEHGRLAEPGPTPDSAIEGKTAIDNLCGAFGGLSAVHHDILVLREFEGLSYREIGDRLGMSRPAVESTLFRARKRLSEEYEELVSGERCLRVRQIVDATGATAGGLRDQRRMARHLAHCQPCRRYAGRAGVDLGAVARPGAGVAARIAGLLPLPAFLRRRWGGEDATSLLSVHGNGALSRLSTSVASTVDPGVASGWAKAVATAATVAVAGVGAGAAFTDRLPLDRLPLSDAPAHRVGSRPDATSVGAPAAPIAARAVDRRRAGDAGKGTTALSAARATASGPAAPASAGARKPAPSGTAPSQTKPLALPFGSSPSTPAGDVTTRVPSAPGADPAEAVKGVLDSVGAATREPVAGGAPAGVLPAAPALTGTLAAADAGAGAAVPATAGGALDAARATALGDTVSSTVSETVMTTTSALTGLGGG